jgi:hypothetical protein
MSIDWSKHFREGMSYGEIRTALRTLSPEACAFLNEEVTKPFKPSKKIQAIKAFRTDSGFGLKTSKEIVDVLWADDVKVSCVRYGDPILLDCIEMVETHLKRAIRHAHEDDKSAAMLLAMREQLADLWTELAELPLP